MNNKSNNINFCFISLDEWIMDIPPEYRSINKYSATLAHKVTFDY